MPAAHFIKKNFALIMGLGLPVLLMAVFFIASTLPQTLSDPPKYDMVFSTQDYSSGTALPVGVNFMVKDSVLKAQYIKLPQPGSYNTWRKLYVYESKTQKVRELPFGLPADVDQITGTREDTVDATKDMKLDTTLESPDGYTLSYDGYSHSGLMNGLFWGGGGYSNESRLRKGSSSVKIASADGRTSFYYGQIQFIGWVKP